MIDKFITLVCYMLSAEAYGGVYLLISVKYARIGGT